MASYTAQDLRKQYLSNYKPRTKSSTNIVAKPVQTNNAVPVVNKPVQTPIQAPVQVQVQTPIKPNVPAVPTPAPIQTNVPQRQDYVSNYLNSNLQARDAYLANQRAINANMAKLQYDNKINNVNTDMTNATQRFDFQLNQLQPQYDKIIQQTNQNAYNEQNNVNKILIRSGMANSGAAVGNAQMIDNNLNSNLKDIELNKQNQIGSINLEKNIALNKYSSEITQLKADQDTFIANGELQAAQQYQALIDQKTREANELYNSDRSFDETKRQYDQNYAFDQAKFDETKRQYNQNYDFDQTKFNESKRQYEQNFSFDQSKFDESKRQYNQNYAFDQTKFDESKRQFDQNYNLDKDKFSESKRQYNQNYSFDQTKFNESKRQYNQNFGLDKDKFNESKRQFDKDMAFRQVQAARARLSGGGGGSGSGGLGGLSLSEALRIKGAQDNNIKELQQRILNAGGDVNTIKKIINTYPLSPEAKTQLYTQFVGTDITNQQIFQRNPLMDQIYKKASQAPNKKVASAIGKNKKNPLFY